MNKLNPIRSLGLATGLFLAFTVPAQAATHGDVATFQQPYSLASATRLEVQGHHAGAAASTARGRGADCRLPRASLSLGPRENAVELREVALNVRTCRAVFERGVPPSWARKQGGVKAESAGARERRSAGAAGVSALANGYRWGGFSRAWYRDQRNGKVVTRVESGADWNTSRGCIGANNTWFRNAADTAGGWFEVSHRWSKINTACNYVISSTNAHFRNNNFAGCSGGPAVDSYYTRVRFVGYPDGRIRGSRTSRNEPSCYGVLIAYYALYRR